MPEGEHEKKERTHSRKISLEKRLAGFDEVELCYTEEEARRETERCRACGDCKLGRHGGICPVTICAKGLLNGPCGGASLGKCEAGNNKDCAWELIYQRLKQQGRLDNLKTFVTPLDYKLQTHPIRVVKEC